MTMSLPLDRGQRRRMMRLLRKTRSRIEALRARVLLLLDEGVVPGVVAERAGCARAAVYRTLYRFEALGEEALLDQRQQRPPSEVTAEVERVWLTNTRLQGRASTGCEIWRSATATSPP